MLKKGLKRFALVSAVAGVVAFGGITFSGNISAFASETEAEATHDSSAVILNVSGMTCGACANKVKTALKACDKVIDVEVSHKSGKAIVKVEEGADAEKLKEAVKHAGFSADS